MGIEQVYLIVVYDRLRRYEFPIAVCMNKEKSNEYIKFSCAGIKRGKKTIELVEIVDYYPTIFADEKYAVYCTSNNKSGYSRVEAIFDTQETAEEYINKQDNDIFKYVLYPLTLECIR